MNYNDICDNLTHSCGGEQKKRNPQYDAYYCTTCFEWLETKCSDPTCEFCSVRPEKAPHDHDNIVQT